MMQGNGYTVHLVQLLARHKNGDAAAKSALIEHAYERLRALARKMFRGGFIPVQGREQTDDILQRGLIKLNKALESQTPATPYEFTGLAALQIRHTLLTLAKEAKKKPTQFGLEPDEIETKFNGTEPLTMSQWTEFHERANALPSEQRAVFDAVFYQGLTQAEARKVLGITDYQFRKNWLVARETLGKVVP